MGAMMEKLKQDPRITQKSLLLRLKVGGPTREMDLHQFHEQYAPIIRGFVRNIGAMPQFEYDPAKGRFRGYLKACVWHAFQKKCQGQRLMSGRSLEEIDADELQ